MPEVTVLARASGEPKASTGSPTAIASESPNSHRHAGPALATLITAMSDSGSLPTTVGRRLSAVAEGHRDGCSSASATTWSLVIT